MSPLASLELLLSKSGQVQPKSISLGKCNCPAAVNKKNRHSGAGRGEIGAKASAELFNQLHPQIIESSMLTIYKTSELYQEIQRGNWKEEGEIEKLAELKALIWNRGQRDFPI